MKTEPVLSAVRKARSDFKKTPAGQLAMMLAERSRWSRKLTIAQNKLERVNLEIASFAADMLPKDSHE